MPHWSVQTVGGRRRMSAGYLSLVAASCGPDVAEPLLPARQGWVIDHEQSPDLVYDWDRSAITSGLVEVVLVDGTSAMINADTLLAGLTEPVNRTAGDRSHLPGELSPT